MPASSGSMTFDERPCVVPKRSAPKRSAPKPTPTAVLRPSSATAMPEEADRADGDVGCAEVVEVAEHVERAGEAGEGAGDRHRADQVLLHADPAVGRRLRVEPDRAHLVAERRPVEEQRRRRRARRARRRSRCGGPAGPARPRRPAACALVGDVVRDRDGRCWRSSAAGRRRRRARSPTQIAIQLSMIVVITSCAPTVAFRKPAIPAQAAPASVAPATASRMCGSGLIPAKRVADPVRDDRGRRSTGPGRRC